MISFALTEEQESVRTAMREFAEQASAAGDHAAASLFEEVRRDEMGHRDAFKAALTKMRPKTER